MKVEERFSLPTEISTFFIYTKQSRFTNKVLLSCIFPLLPPPPLPIPYSYLLEVSHLHLLVTYYHKQLQEMRIQLFPWIIAQNCLSYHYRRQVWLPTVLHTKGFFTKYLYAHLSSHRSSSFPKLSYGGKNPHYLSSFVFSSHISIASQFPKIETLLHASSINFLISSKVNLLFASMVPRTGKLLPVLT